MKKVVLLGDSITQGLGSKQINFSNKLGSLLGRDYEVCNCALTGTTVDYPLNLLAENKMPDFDVALILYGNVDAQIRPNREGVVFPRIPERYQQNGMLMPRPFYSKSKKKKVFQLVDNWMRSIFSELIRMIDGTEQWVPLSDFENKYELLIDKLSKSGNAKIICVSTVYIDDDLFRGSEAEYIKYNESIRNISTKKGIGYLDIYTPLKLKVEREGWSSCFNADHFHPNGLGYNMMAELISDAILTNNEVLS